MIKRLVSLSLAILLYLGMQSFAIARDIKPYYKDYVDN